MNQSKNIAKALNFNLVEFGGEKIEHKKMTFCGVVLGWLVEWRVSMFNLRKGDFDGVNLFQIL